MKKNIVLTMILAIVFSVFLGASAQAASGDVVGSIYSTDIKACINGVWVDSYNIGGKTVVIVEDITNQFKYSDALRTLIIDDLSPERLISGKESNNQKPGAVIGNIYETDIKTYFRGKKLTSYSLNGKMAIVVEELGWDNTFSDIGGKFVWNADERTITLESMYRYPYEIRTMLEDAHFSMLFNYADGVLKAELLRTPLVGGQTFCEKVTPDNSITPILYNDEIIGYRCSFPDFTFSNNESGDYSLKEVQTPVDYLYIDKFKDMISDAEPVKLTVDDWLNYFEKHTLSTIKESFETDDYMFLYMFSSAVMSGRDRLIKITKADGTKIEYQDFLDSVSPKRFENVEIDRENEKVYFQYDVDYVIDLKTDEVRVYAKPKTDIGVGSYSGEPSEYNAISARNTQYEYKLIADNEEMIVGGFGIPEFYYANMLPLAETFDFLNIKYSFENDVLTIDTSEAKSFDFEQTENKIDILGEEPINYLFVDKVVLNGEETEITYEYISGHFENTYIGRAKAEPYVCNGKVYINDSFITLLCEQK